MQYFTWTPTLQPQIQILSFHSFGIIRSRIKHRSSQPTTCKKFSLVFTGRFPVAMNLNGKVAKSPPPAVKPKPKLQSLRIEPEIPPYPSHQLTPGQISDSVVSPPEEFRDPLPPFPAPPQFAAYNQHSDVYAENFDKATRLAAPSVRPPAPADFDCGYADSANAGRIKRSTKKQSPTNEEATPPPYCEVRPQPRAASRTRHGSSKQQQYKEDAKYSPRPQPRPRHTSHSSVGKTNSADSNNSGGSSILSSGTDSIPSSPSSLRRHQIRKQRASGSRQLHTRFLEKHAHASLTGTLPRPDAKAKSPYSEDWMKKKQYLSFSKQNSVRDVKFDKEGNILLTTKYSVQIYDANGNFTEKIYQHRVTEPWGLFIHPSSGNVLVSDFEEGCVKEFNGLGIVVQEYGPVPNPCGVAVSTTGYVFVCSQSEKCVYVFDKRGEVVTKIGKSILTSPTYIVLHGKSILVSEDSTIVAFNVSNEVEFVYGQKDGSDHPACLSVDTKTGYLISTSYYKDSIVALNKSMQRAIRIKDIKRPLVCAISPFGHLLIGEYVSSKGMLFRMFRM